MALLQSELTYLISYSL